MSALGERWRAANVELDRALALSADARAPWLAALRARDPALAADVQTLLAERDAASAAGFLEAGPNLLETTHTGPAAGAAVELRVLARTALAWSPLLALMVVMIGQSALGIRSTEPFGGTILMALATLVMLVGAVVAILHPARGLQDRMAGTWIVPR